MTGRSYIRHWQLRMPQARSARHASEPFCRHVSVHTKRKAPYPKATSSQLLRFALTGIGQPIHGETSKSELNEHLREIFLEKWPSNTPPPPLWSFSQQVSQQPDQKVLLRGLNHDVRNLRHLQTFIERNVNGEYGSSLLQTERCSSLAKALERCQRHNSYGEILAMVNGIISRLERLQVPVSDHLYVLGIYYASLAFCEPAFERHLRSYLAINRPLLDLASSISLVDALLTSFRMLSFQNPNHDTRKMFKLITGEGGYVGLSLHSILYWADPEASMGFVGKYLSLLANIGSDALFQEMWDRTLEQISPSATFEQFQSAYLCVLAVVNAGYPARALAYLTQISNRVDNTLPHISKFDRLDVLLDTPAFREALTHFAGEKEYMMVLEAQLQHIEKRLGISWKSSSAHHTSISDPLCVATEQPLLTIDGESSGYGSSERLIAEIEALGCSNSTTSLEKIASYLDDYDGDLIPVTIPFFDGSASQFYWIPRRSPIEFRSTSASRCSSTLGLILVKPDHNGLPWTLQSTLNLMQLGYLVRAQASVSEDQSKTAPQLEETGHIVAWDRVSGQFLIVFGGQPHGLAKSPSQWQSPSVPFGLNAIMKIVPMAGASDITQPWSSSLGFNMSKYHIDVDPSPNLLD